MIKNASYDHNATRFNSRDANNFFDITQIKFSVFQNSFNGLRSSFFTPYFSQENDFTCWKPPCHHAPSIRKAEQLHRLNSTSLTISCKITRQQTSSGPVIPTSKLCLAITFDSLVHYDSSAEQQSTAMLGLRQTLKCRRRESWGGWAVDIIPATHQ
jgi:hypothetical protein